jgi:peptidoglycan-associated lipoprotein
MLRPAGRVALISLLSLLALAGGCKKKPVAVAPPPPPPPTAPPPARPTVTLQAAPATIQRGQTATLTWSSSNATGLNLAPGVGNVAPQGSTTVTPADSITYTITATGPGGMADASTRVTVTLPPPPPPPAAAPQPTLDELFTRNVKDAYFDYDKASIRPDARDALSQTAQFLRSYPDVKVSIEGHCDERGSTEYNLALGDRRAQAVKDFMASLGITADRMDTISYGKERQACSDHAESCWQQNRRGHFVRK